MVEMQIKMMSVVTVTVLNVIDTDENGKRVKKIRLITELKKD